MCGIAGYQGTAAPGVLPDMLRTLRHRGPDDTGLHEEPSVGLGHDPPRHHRSGGRAAADGQRGRLALDRLQRRDLQLPGAARDLEAGGHRFRTRSDTEVDPPPVRGRTASACVERLRGMFAFAIWDARPRGGSSWRATGWERSRSTTGIESGLFLFASEIKALLCHPAVSREARLAALPSLPRVRLHARRALHLRQDPQASARPYRDAHRRAPDAAPLLAAPAGGAARPRPEPAETRRRVSATNSSEAVRTRLKATCRSASSSRAASTRARSSPACARSPVSRIATFSIGFGGSAALVRRAARTRRLVAQRFETDHHEEILEPDVRAIAPGDRPGFDEPFADSSAIPTFIVAQATARHVKVALSGIGGDETFGGYPRYLGVRVLRALRPPAAPLRAIAGAARWPGSVADSEKSRNWADWVRRFADRRRATHAGPLHRLDALLQRRGAGDAWRRPRCSRAWSGPVDPGSGPPSPTGAQGDAVDGAFRIDLDTYLPDDLLVDGRSDEHGQLPRAPRAVLRPPARRGEPAHPSRDEDSRHAPEGAC